MCYAQKEPEKIKHFFVRSKELEDVVKEFDKMRVTGICEPKFPTSV